MKHVKMKYFFKPILFSELRLLKNFFNRNPGMIYNFDKATRIQTSA